MINEIKVLDEALDMATKHGCYSRKQVVQIDHAIEVMKIQANKISELQELKYLVDSDEELANAFANALKRKEKRIPKKDSDLPKRPKHKGN